MRRFFLLLAILLAILGAFAVYWYSRPLPKLAITTWSGEYGHAQRSALIEPYRDIARVDTVPNVWDGDLGEVSRAVASHTYKGDVIDFELPKAVEACREGLLEKIDATSLPMGADKTPAARDFVPGAIGDCWVGSIVYSRIILFAKNRFTVVQPTTLADFFDTAKFPGPRALAQGAKFNLEMALLADGVASKDIYKTLESDAGVARALKKLGTLKPNLIWWHDPSEPAKLIANGQAVFTTALNSDVFDHRTEHPGVIWDGQLYEFDVFGVPKGDPKKDMAMDFIRYATGSAPLAQVADWVALGPARRSAWPMVGDNPDLKLAMAPYLPTSHFETAFAVNDDWWRDHAQAMEARFQAWLSAH